MPGNDERSIAHVPFDDALDAIGHIQRRKFLFALLDHIPQGDSPATLADSEAETDVPENLVNVNHVHLPKLIEYGFIEWNRGTHEVVPGPKSVEIKPSLDLLAGRGDELPGGWLSMTALLPDIE